jgi:hypothetical protein
MTIVFVLTIFGIFISLFALLDGELSVKPALTEMERIVVTVLGLAFTMFGVLLGVVIYGW